MWRNLAFVFLAFSLVFFIAASLLLWQRYYNPNRLFFSSPPVIVTSKFGFWPERLAIPSLAIDLPVIPADIKNGLWETTPLGVSYLLTSVRPGQIGNAIFYGHNWPRLLGQLKKINPGDSIILRGKSGALTFKVAKTQVVSPRAVEVLAAGTEPQLTLYTCTGFADTQRFVVTAYAQAPK